MPENTISSYTADQIQVLEGLEVVSKKDPACTLVAPVPGVYTI